MESGPRIVVSPYGDCKNRTFEDKHRKQRLGPVPGPHSVVSAFAKSPSLRVAADAGYCADPVPSEVTLWSLSEPKCNVPRRGRLRRSISRLPRRRFGLPMPGRSTISKIVDFGALQQRAIRAVPSAGIARFLAPPSPAGSFFVPGYFRCAAKKASARCCAS
jgi:hypothetical protein